ncbi:MAG: preprotein translocase subunit YajC [Chloroflexi bacterium]|nr:MAG: preprotein translocase subunit YajC [Chloroflexota bacterium]
MESLWLIALVYPVVIALLFYFAFLRPVQQERKKQKQQLQSLRVGDEVLTQSGFIAVVKDVRIPKEPGLTEVILDLGGIEVRAVASAIVERLNAAETPEDEATKKRQTLEARG